MLKANNIRILKIVIRNVGGWVATKLHKYDSTTIDADNNRYENRLARKKTVQLVIRAI